MDGSHQGIADLPELFTGKVKRAAPDQPPLDWPLVKRFLNRAAKHGKLSRQQVVSAAADVKNAWKILIEHGDAEMRAHFKKKIKQFYLLYENLEIDRKGTKIGPMPELVEPDEA